MIFCKCGVRTNGRNAASVGDSKVQDAMNVQTRTRECRECGNVIHTTEMQTGELSELRRRAYLWERYVDSERAS